MTAIRAAVALLVALSAAGAAEPIDLRSLDPATMSAIAAYVKDPAAGRSAMLVLGRGDLSTLPVPVLLAVADAQMRGRQYAAAAQTFSAVLAQNPAPAWAQYADVGLGALALGSGDLAGARAFYQQAVAIGTGDLTVPRLVIAVVDAADGRGAGAIPVLEAIAGDGSRPPSWRSLAALGAAYARYWAGDDGAAQAFEAVEALDPSGPFVDDARYGAARARWEAGDVDGARAALRNLADQEFPGAPRGRVTRAMVDLEPDAILGGVSRLPRDRAIQSPADGLAAMFDGNGAALARAALRRLRAAHQDAERQAAGNGAVTIQAAAARRARRATPRRLSAVAMASGAAGEVGRDASGVAVPDGGGPVTTAGTEVTSSASRHSSPSQDWPAERRAAASVSGSWTPVLMAASAGLLVLVAVLLRGVRS